MDSEKNWWKNFEIDVLHTVRGCEALMEHLKKSGEGSVVIISSTNAIETFAAPMAYNAMKAALITYSKQLSQFVGKYNVRVNSLCPGPIYFEGGAWEMIKGTNQKFYDSTVRQIPVRPHGHARRSRARRHVPGEPGLEPDHRRQRRGRQRLHEGRAVLNAPCPRQRSTRISSVAASTTTSTTRGCSCWACSASTSVSARASPRTMRTSPRSRRATSWSRTRSTSCPDEATAQRLRDYVAGGKRWLALHGTNSILRYVKGRGWEAPRDARTFMETLGSQFVAHPPIAPYRVESHAAVAPAGGRHRTVRRAGRAVPERAAPAVRDAAAHALDRRSQGLCRARLERATSRARSCT